MLGVIAKDAASTQSVKRTLNCASELSAKKHAHWEKSQCSVEASTRIRDSKTCKEIELRMRKRVRLTYQVG